MKTSSKATDFTHIPKFERHLDKISATLVSYPTIEHLQTYLPEFVSLTWLDDSDQIEEFMELNGITRSEAVDAVFNRSTLPTALETIRLVFYLEGLDLTGVTHVIRHRLFSYSSKSSDPVSMEGRAFLENDAFLDNPKLLERARKLCNDAQELYCDALDSGMPFYDARHYMPRAVEEKYYMAGDIAQFINFINVRLGRQNQPTSDNILALRMRQAILKVYPVLEKQMPAESIQHAYINNINSKYNLNTYPPDKLHRVELKRRNIDFYNAKFKHPKSRDSYKHNIYFQQLFNAILKGDR